jgi:DNA modification methylase
MLPERVIIGRATLYLGDCRVILPSLPKHDLLATDPPYGINKDGQVRTTGGNGGRKAHEFKGWDAASRSGWTASRGDAKNLRDI